ncbi:MAG: VOC family protein [Chloroflexota bacterium]
MKIRVDHLLINTLDMDGVVRWYRDTLGMREASRTTLTLSDGSHIDNRVFQAPDDPFTVVAGMGIEPDGLKRKQTERDGPGVHHVAYEVDDLDAAISELKARGVEFLTEEPVEEADLRQIFTRKDPTTGLIHEFIQRVGGRPGFTQGNMSRLADMSTG